MSFEVDALKGRKEKLDLFGGAPNQLNWGRLSASGKEGENKTHL